MIHFYLDSSGQHEEAELINVLNFRYGRTEIAFARMLENLLMQPCVHDSEFGEHSRESLKVMHLYHFMIVIKNALCFSARDFQLKHANNKNILCNRGLA